MGVPAMPKPKSVAPVDTTKAMIAALNFNATQTRIRKSQGRRSTFLTGGAPRSATTGTPRQTANTALGQ